MITGFSNANEWGRTTSLPEYGKIIGEFKEATAGWIKTAVGQWVSKPNRIPAYVREEEQEYPRNDLGIDNFKSIILREIQIQNKKYLILIKKSTDGRYKYPNIYEDWYNYTYVQYWVLNTKEIDKFNYKGEIEAEPKVIELESLIYGDSSSSVDIYDIENSIRKSIQEKLNERNGDIDNKDNERYLVFNILPLVNEGKLRFTMVKKYHASYHDPGEYSFYIDGDDSNLSEYEVESLLSSDTFKKHYFEVDFNKFNELFHLTDKYVNAKVSKDEKNDTKDIMNLINKLNEEELRELIASVYDSLKEEGKEYIIKDEINNKDL